MRRCSALFNAADSHPSVLFVGVGGRAVGLASRFSLRFPPVVWGVSDSPWHARRPANFVLLSEQSDELAHSVAAEAALSADGPLSAVAGERADLAVVAVDLEDGLGRGAGPALARRAREGGALTVGAVLLPLRVGRSSARASEAMRAMQEECDAVVLLESGALGEEGVGEASFFELHEAWLDMAGHGLAQLAGVTSRENPVVRVSMAGLREVLGKKPGVALAREVRLACAQSQETGEGKERGKKVLQEAMTNRLFPANDMTAAHAVLVAVESAKDLTYAEIEQAFAVHKYVGADTLLVQGLAYAENPGISLMLAVVSDSVMTQEEETKILMRHQKRNTSTASHLWKTFKEWM